MLTPMVRSGHFLVHVYSEKIKMHIIMIVFFMCVQFHPRPVVSMQCVLWCGHTEAHCEVQSVSFLHSD